MLSPAEVAERVGDMIEARMAGDNAHLLTLIDTLLKGPQGDAFNVVLVLSGLLAEGMGDEPEDGFYKIEVSIFDEQGRLLEGSTHDLPDHVTCFVQMVVAVANGDRDMAKDLFVAYVAGDAHRALALLVLAINEVTHANGGCPGCSGDELAS